VATLEAHSIISPQRLMLKNSLDNVLVMLSVGCDRKFERCCGDLVYE